MHTIGYGKHGHTSKLETENKQEPFWRVAPVVKAALLIGACGGFVLASVLTLSLAFAIPPGMWWEAVVQAHGHLQLYGWAGLFVLGIALHFFPRLCGAPLAGARFLPWLLGIAIVSLILRAVSQPGLIMVDAPAWRLMLVNSGLFEVIAIGGILFLIGVTARRGPPAKTRPAYWSVLPFFVGAFCSSGIASIVNLLNVVQAAQGSGLALYRSDALNVTLGLFGFLVPIALAMSARSLPMYAELDGFPRRALWPLSGTYFTGLALMSVGTANNLPQFWANIIGGLGMLLTGGVVLLFVGTFLRLMRKRGRLPQRVAQLAPKPVALAQSYKKQIKKEQANYGPFVGLVASSYLWALLGALLLLIDGLSLLATGSAPVAIDAIRHSFAIGFIALLICGIAPRMLPSFSGCQIVSPRLVSATLWLGNAAVVLRVSPLLLSPFIHSAQGYALSTILMGLSGPCGLALAICLTINLWPTLYSSARHTA
ncbi:hypothetical protein [Dictyobacter formicarum]|uniref:Cytochrome oxidase subunit I profile domain-containing protein n=1 Tax=Dictyobacter formicarum TaxID=2778368 RepID=A0ABQ3VE00_9CHLR|nr:hypothetical protein [Dictyobacter formicarum]GHO83613.1 hypothetical protein KSZ_16190 [Dictyobacter formicarum]